MNESVVASKSISFCLNATGSLLQQFFNFLYLLLESRLILYSLDYFERK